MADESMDLNLDEILETAEFEDEKHPIDIVQREKGVTEGIEDLEAEVGKVQESHDKYEERKVINEPQDLMSINVKGGSQLQQLIEDPLETDELYLAIENDDPAPTILRNALKEYAEEIAYLKAWRKHNYKIDADITSEISEKRMKALFNITRTVLEREKIAAKQGKGKIDFHSENFSKVFQFFLQEVQETFKTVNIPEQYQKIFFPQLAKRLDGFEKKAEKIYYGKPPR